MLGSEWATVADCEDTIMSARDVRWTAVHLRLSFHQAPRPTRAISTLTRVAARCTVGGLDSPLLASFSVMLICNSTRHHRAIGFGP